MLPLIGIILYFFIQFIRPQDWIVTSLMNAPLDYVVLGFIIVVGFGKITSGVSQLLKEWPFRFMVMYFLAVCISNIVNFEFESLMTYSSIILKSLILYVIISTTQDDFKKRFLFIFFLSLFVVTIGYQSLYQIKNGIGWAGQELNWRGSIKWIGDYDGTNSLCVLFNFILPFLLGFAFGPWNKILRLLGLVASGITLYCIYLTESRGGMIALFVILGIFLWSRVKKKAVVITFLIAASLAVVAFGPSRISSGDTSDSSARYRIKMWEKGLEAIRYHKPIFGIGYGNFVKYSYRLEPHNAFVANMAELGLVGLFVYVGMFYCFFKEWLSVTNKSQMTPKEISIHKSIMLSLIGWMSSAFFLTLRKSFFPYILFGLITSTQMLKNKPITIDKSDLKRIAAIEIGGIMLIWFAERLYFALNP